jgi:hypothetical protein
VALCKQLVKINVVAIYGIINIMGSNNLVEIVRFRCSLSVESAFGCGWNSCCYSNSKEKLGCLGCMVIDIYSGFGSRGLVITCNITCKFGPFKGKITSLSRKGD